MSVSSTASIDDRPTRMDLASQGLGVASPRRLARLLARVRAGSLDGELIGDADPLCSPLLAARAAALVDRDNRLNLADSFDGLLRAVRGRQRRWSVIQSRAAVLANASKIEELVTLLRTDRPVRARGVAMLTQLLTDGTGPAFCGSGEELAARVEAALSAL